MAPGIYDTNDLCGDMANNTGTLLYHGLKESIYIYEQDTIKNFGVLQ